MAIDDSKNSHFVATVETRQKIEKEPERAMVVETRPEGKERDQLWRKLGKRVVRVVF